MYIHQIFPSDSCYETVSSNHVHLYGDYGSSGMVGMMFCFFQFIRSFVRRAYEMDLCAYNVLLFVLNFCILSEQF